MKFGLDLDGTVYAYPEFFAEFIEAMSARGHQFFCTSAHGRDMWEADCERLRSLSINPDLISPDMMYPQQHTDIAKKGAQAQQLDMVFEDDWRVQLHSDTPIVHMPIRGKRRYQYR